MLGLGTLLWSVVRLAAQTFGELGGHARQFRVRSVLLVGWLVLWVWLGPYDAFNAVFWTIVFLVAWRTTGKVWLLLGRIMARFGRTLPPWPAVLDYDRWVGRRLRGMWRRWRLYEKRWSTTMRNLHMTEVVDFGRDDCPELKSVVEAQFGGVDIVRFKGLWGQAAEDYDAIAEPHLRKAFKARSVRVFDEPGSDLLRLEFARGEDPLSEPIPLPPIPDQPEDIDLEAIPIGVDDRGLVVTVPIIGSHLLVGGLTGAGKGSILHALILGLGPLIREGSVRIWGLDPKRGVEMQFVEPLCYRFCEGTNEQMAAMLEEALAVMDASAAQLKVDRVRKIAPTPERPLNIVFIDELGRLTGKQLTPALKSRLNSLIGQLVNVGRAPGVGVAAFCQVPTVDVVEHRREFPRKIAMHLESSTYVDLLLGPGALKAGARCHDIPLSMPGCAFMRVDGVREPRRFRAYWITDEVIQDAAERFRPPVVDEPAATPPHTAPGKTLKEVKAPRADPAAAGQLAVIDRPSDDTTVNLDKRETVQRQVQIVVPDCPPSMRSKEMRHGRARDRMIAKWQRMFVAALAEHERPGERVGPVRGLMVHTFTDSYHRDLDNLWIAVKAIGDALKDAGWFEACEFNEDTPQNWELTQSISPVKASKEAGRSTVVTLSWDEPLVD